MTRSILILGLVGVAFAAAVGACESGGASTTSSTHWISCDTMNDCEGVPGAVACTDGYCVDASGRRLTASVMPPGSGGQGGVATQGNAGQPTGGGLASGATGSGGTGSGGTGSAGTTCDSVADCTLISSCCVCMVALAGTPEPDGCVSLCEQDQCTVMGFSADDVDCSYRFCGVPAANGNCNPEDVECNTIQPTCPEGYLPSVIDRCWGPCVIETSCVSAS